MIDADEVVPDAAHAARVPRLDLNPRHSRVYDDHTPQTLRIRRECREEFRVVDAVEARLDQDAVRDAMRAPRRLQRREGGMVVRPIARVRGVRPLGREDVRMRVDDVRAHARRFSSS